MNINSIITNDKKHKYMWIKQSDNTSPITLLLRGANGQLLSSLNGACTITLMDLSDGEVRASISGTVTSGSVTFKITQDLYARDHSLEIDVAGQKFPSDGDFIVHVAASHEMAELNIIEKGTKEAAIAEIKADISSTMPTLVSDYMAAHVSDFRGEAFEYSDFTQAQLDALKVKGDIGDSAYQIWLKAGNTGTVSDYLASLKGAKGDKFVYSDFTQAQLDALKVKGDTGATGASAYQVWKDAGNVGTVTDYLNSLKGAKGDKGDGLQIDGVVNTTAELPAGTTKLTYLVGTSLYFRQAGSSTWTQGPNIKGVDGAPGSVITIQNGYWYKDGVNTGVKADLSADLVAITKLTNLMATYGGFHSDSNADGVADGFTKSGNGTGFTWANGVQTNAGNYNTDTTYLTGPTLTSTKVSTNYIAIMDMTSTLTNDRTLKEYMQLSGPSNTTRPFIYKASDNLAYVAYKTDADTTSQRPILYKLEAGTTTYDNLRIYEITQSEYDAIQTMTPAQIKNRYPYTEPVLSGVTRFVNIAGQPTDASGGSVSHLLGDNYVNNIGNVYTKTAPNVYTYQFSIKGATGTAGTNGLSIYSVAVTGAVTDTNGGSSAYPTNTLVLNTTDWNLYKKTGTNTYTVQGNIKGATGVAGTNGTNGTNGKSFYTSNVTGAITDTNGGSSSYLVGDSVANAAGDVYQKTGTNAYTLMYNIKGPQGEPGTGGTGSADMSNYYTKAEIDKRGAYNVNKAFGFVGDDVFDNYAAFKQLETYIANTPNPKIEFDGTYNGKQAVYRVNQYVTISNIDGTPASGSPTHIKWKGKNITIITNGAKFVNMPTNGFTKTKAFTASDGSWHYAKEEPITLFDFSEADGVIADYLFVDGENTKVKFDAGFTSKENDNPRWSADNKPLAEGRGHGIIFGGTTNVAIRNLISINQCVDGVAIGFNSNLSTMVVNQTTNFSITNAITTGNGRLGFSGLGCHAGHITNLLSEYNGCNKNADGKYIYFSPAGGVDIEPHHSPIAMDNNTPTSYKVEDWNGNMVIQNARIRYNSGTQIACTSTLLTRNVIFERCTVRPPKNRTGDHQLIQSSLQNCTFKDMDVDGRLSDGALSRVMFYGAGYVSESTGVITGQAANVWSQVQGGKWANIEPWVNTDGNTTYNEIKTGEYGLHNIVFKDLVMENVRFTLRTIRRFVFDNVVMNIPSDSAITKLYMWNAAMKNVVILNRKSSNITLDLGTGDSQSNFENLRITTGKFDWATGTKKYKTATISSENLDVYDYTRAMEYLLANSSTGTTTPPADTTAPNAPSVNTVYTNSTTVSGTAEASSTVIATFNDNSTAQATADASGNYSISTTGKTLTSGQSITVKAKDAAGNISTGTTVTIQAVQASDTTPPAAPTVNAISTSDTSITGTAEASSTVTATFNGGTTATATANSSTGAFTIAKPSGVTLTAGQTVSVTARDAAGNVSTATVKTIQAAATTSTNLLGAMTNTAAVTEGWGYRKNLNSNFSLNWNNGHGGINGTAGWDTTTKDQLRFTNLAYDGTTTGTTNERYIYFKFEGYKASTVYTFSFDLTYTGTDDLTMFGGVQYGVGSTAKKITLTFKTDANGTYGYKWDGGVSYGTKADGSAVSVPADVAFVNKANLQINKTLILDKMMLNEGSTAQPYVASA